MPNCKFSKASSSNRRGFSLLIVAYCMNDYPQQIIFPGHNTVISTKSSFNVLTRFYHKRYYDRVPRRLIFRNHPHTPQHTVFA